MNKSDLISLMAEKADITKVQASASLEAFTTSVAKTLKKDDKLTLIGFGTFSVSKRSARKGRNPQTGEVINIKASKSAKFKASKDLNSKI